MTTKYLDSNGLLYLWQKIRNTFVSDVTWDSTNKKLVKKKKTGTSGAEVATDLVTLSSVALSGSYDDLSNKPTIPTLKNVFGKVKVGSTTIEADTTQDTLELVAGDHVTLTPDATNDKVTITSEAGVFIASYGTTTYAEISSAISAGKAVFVYISGTNSYLDGRFGYLANTSQSSHGFINHDFSSSPDVTFIDCDSTNSWDTYTETLIYNATVNGVSIVDNGTAKLVNATTTTAGAMSATDKSKLDGIATGAEVNVQSDWSQSDSTADDYIKNKPTIPTPEVFIAEYGTTTFTEITNAVTAGKEVLVRREYSSITSYAQLTFYSSSEIYFSCYQRLNTGLNQALYIKITSSGTWSYGGKEIVTPDGTQSLTNKSYEGYTLADACAKDVVTSILSDSNDLPTVTAVKNYVASAITGAAAFQGTAPTTFAPTNYKAGYYWVIGTAGTYAGQTCEPGDMIFATADGTSYSASDFDVVQTNLDITSISNAEIDTIVAA